MYFVNYITGFCFKGQGRSEPVPIKVKCDREGLGLATKRKEQLEEINKFREIVKRKHQKLQGNFMQRMSDKFSVKETEKDLEKCQKVCEELDGRAVSRFNFTHKMPSL